MRKKTTADEILIHQTSKIYVARPFIAKKIEAEMGLLDSGYNLS